MTSFSSLRPSCARWLAAVAVALAGCGGTTASTPADASADVIEDATRDALSPLPGTVVPLASCARTTPCGQPGRSCCLGGTPCYCQTYGQSRCLGDPVATTGHSGDSCTSANGCDPGLTCVAFGPGTLCLLCGQ
jgi:hypothetical protein